MSFTQIVRKRAPRVTVTKATQNWYQRPAIEINPILRVWKSSANCYSRLLSWWKASLHLFTRGSFIASLLFIDFINDLHDLCKSVFSFSCADDAKFTALNKSKCVVQIDSSRVKKSSDYHGLPLNTGKCHYLSLSNNNRELCLAKSLFWKHTAGVTLKF